MAVPKVYPPNLVTITCAGCKQEVTVTAHKNGRRFCAASCRKAYNKSPEGQARYKDRPYRSKEHHAELWAAWSKKHPKPTVDTERAKKSPWNKGLTAETDPRVAKGARSLGDALRGKPLSPTAYTALLAHVRRGPANNKWKGGITPQTVKDRGSAEYRLWRAAVYRRDRWTCTNCGAKAHGKGTIVAHHILDWENHPSERYVVANGTTFCRPCHALLDPKIHDNKRGWDKPHLRKIVRGEGSYHAKLTERQAINAIAAMKAGDSVAMVTRHFGIAYSSMDDIKRVRTWKHLDREAIEPCPLSVAMLPTEQLRLGL